MDLRRDRIATAKMGTNHWIWKNDAYRTWEDKLSSVLWIAGKPGSGKSVLAKTLQEKLLAEGGPKDKLKCWWYYSARDNLTQHKQMFSVLLYQLLSQAPNFFESVEMVYKDVLKQCEGQSQITWPLSRLTEALSAIINFRSSPYKSCLVMIDGLDEGTSLDESNDCSRTSALHFLLGLTGRAIPLKIIFLSRPSEDIAKTLQNALHIAMHSVNRPDIDYLIDKGLDAITRTLYGYDSDDEGAFHTSYPISPQPPFRSTMADGFPLAYTDNIDIQREELLSDIRNYLKIHANGVVLWVTTVLQLLKNKCKTEPFLDVNCLREELHCIPLELGDVYSHIIVDLLNNFNGDRARLEKSRQILMWIFVSSKHRFQLQDLFEVMVYDFSNDEKAARPRALLKLSGWVTFQRDIQKLCGPLVEVVPNSPPADISIESRSPAGWDILQFPHETVRVFFSTEAARDLRFSPHEAEQVVREQRLTYLKQTITHLEPLLFMEGLDLSTIPNLCVCINTRPLLCFILLNFELELGDTTFAHTSMRGSSLDSRYILHLRLSREFGGWPRPHLDQKLAPASEKRDESRLRAQVAWPFYSAALLLNKCALLPNSRPIGGTGTSVGERGRWLMELFLSAFLQGQLNTTIVLTLLFIGQPEHLSSIAYAMLHAAVRLGLRNEADIIRERLQRTTNPVLQRQLFEFLDSLDDIERGPVQKLGDPRTLRMIKSAIAQVCDYGIFSEDFTKQCLMGYGSAVDTHFVRKGYQSMYWRTPYVEFRS
jgi:hypothetical protein